MESESSRWHSATAEVGPAPTTTTTTAILAADTTFKKMWHRRSSASISTSSSSLSYSSSCSSSSAGLLLLVFTAVVQLTVTGAISCSMCDSTVHGEACLHYPPPGTHCSFSNCITVIERRERKFHSVKMSCSPIAFPATCMEGRDALTQDVVELCYWTCDKDDCNRPMRKSLHQILQLLSK